MDSPKAALEWRQAQGFAPRIAPALNLKRSPSPDVTEPEPIPQPDPVAEAEDSDPRESVKTARQAERIAWKRLLDSSRRNENDELYRRANSAYIAARQNRMKAESDYREWKRQEGITLFLSEAETICAKPHQAAAQMLTVMPKQLSQRLVNQPAREIERTLAEWCDNLTEVIRAGI